MFDEIDTWGPLPLKYVVSAAFSNYVLALAKNLYEKRARKTLMKLTIADNFESEYFKKKNCNYKQGFRNSNLT
jgi:hypothetical protein